MNKTQKAFNHCCWIGPSWQVDCGGEENRYYAFRKHVQLPDKAKRARVRITADARYVLWVNGKFVGRGPARCFPEHQSYDEYDLAPFLKKGANWVAVLVHQFGKSNGQYVFRFRTGLLMDGEIRFTNSSKMQLRTDLSWQVREADWYERTHARISQHLGFQERYNGGSEPADWRNPADVKKALSDKQWRLPFYVGPVGCPPWRGFEPRGLAPMTEYVVTPVAIVWGATGRNAPNVLQADNLLHIWKSEKRIPLMTIPQPDSKGWVLVKPSGRDYTALSFDFGWNHAAYARIEVREANGGEIIDSFYSPALQPSGTDPEPAGGFGTSYEGMADRFIVGPGQSTFESFGIRGYRQHILVIRSKQPIKIRVTARRTHHAVENRGQFTCSDERFNRIWTVSDLTLKAGMLDAFVDNNSREQAQWLHDGCVIGLAAWATYGDTTLWRRGLRQWGQSQAYDPDGCLNSMAPMEPSFSEISDYSFAWVWSLADYYQITGDKSLLDECAETVDRLVRDFVVPNLTREHLFISPEGHWMFLDWSEIDMSPYNLMVNLMLLRAFRCGAEIGRICRKPKLASECTGRANQLQAAILKRFWSPRDKAWHENSTPSADVMKIFNPRLEKQDTCPWNRGWPWTKPAWPYTRQSNALAVLLGLGTPQQQANAAACVARSVTPDQLAISTMSPMWLDKVLGALFQTGYDTEAIQALRDSYGCWVDQGAVGWGELWDADTTTHTQTYGVAVNWLLTSYILGVRPTRPGFTEAIFDPRPGNLTWAKGIVPTPQGDIRVSWSRDSAGRIQADIRAPRGIKIIRKQHGRNQWT